MAWLGLGLPIYITSSQLSAGGGATNSAPVIPGVVLQFDIVAS